MKRLRICGLAVVAVMVLGGTHAVAQNLFVNPGFEDPITSDGPPFVGFWEAFQGGGALASRETIEPHSGQAHLSAGIDNTNNTFAGAFQDVTGLVPGTMMEFAVWHKTTSLPFDIVSELRIEWRNNGAGTEISRSQILPVPGTDYTRVSLFAPVPVGADTARAVYAIQTFTNGSLPDLGTVYVDDAFLGVVPEPATLGLLGVALLTSLGVWRKRSA